ncbi:carbohydrate ABC transporter substrate-binding protein, CUT1 family [Nakamurella panacisegetis]|uniref:Carbohydrate ABC transporter substrate-binding protein, CUT1 family n=1 Tax=Nakamurella panacisegetis TaxID=1090615 RepID=A0A1H0S8L1_9ACTN|nr:extracellular solute-binding protein [Nakamurella panacisegetis]SDP38090.1 carbohydrate ABC transporter substrate-binding protein, CUT1 family [Nakamurella panacisegetis]
MKRTSLAIAGLLLGTIALTACGSSSGGSGSSSTATGPIKIWYSNNAQEVAWGKQAVAAWNTAHPDQTVTAEEVPAGKSSEEVIGAAITAGTEPCLIYNTSPAAVPQFQKQGGLVDLNSFADGASYIEGRTGDISKQYQSSDGHYYQLPWKSNPVMIFYNKKIFAKAGITTPALATYADFIATSKKIVSSGAAKYAIFPSPASQFYQSWFDFYPLYAAETGGKQLLVDKKSTFNSPEGLAVANFWKTLYTDKLAGTETYNGDSFADGVAAMAVVGPWAIANYKGKVDWGVVPVPTSKGTAADKIHTFSDAKNVGMYASCQNRGTAWEFMKFSTSVAQDSQLLTLTGQMPLRKDVSTVYADYLTKNPEYKLFADQAARTVEVPNVSNSVQIWQTFRDAWSSSVIFGKSDPATALPGAATKIDSLAGQS